MHCDRGDNRETAAPSWRECRDSRRAPSRRQAAHLKSPFMNFLDMLRDASTRNDSMLCVGLDPEPSRFPGAMKGESVTASAP